MQNVVYELRRIHLPRTWVNKGKEKGRGCYTPALLHKGQFAASASLPQDAYFGAVLKRQVVSDNGLPSRSVAAPVIVTR